MWVPLGICHEGHPCRNASPIMNPDADEISWIAESFGIPLDYLSGSLDPDEVSRAENLGPDAAVGAALISLLFPLLKNPADKRVSYVNHTLSIVYTAECAVTSVRTDPGFLNYILQGRYDFVSEVHDPRSLIMELVWQITRAYVLACRDVMYEIEHLQEKFSTSTKTEDLLQLADLDKSIIFLRTAVTENKHILARMSEDPRLVSEQGAKAMMHDVLTESRQADSMSNQAKQLLERLDTTLAGVIQNNLSEIMKTLTSVTIIMTIPMFLAGLWGMNVALPFDDHLLAFVILVLLTVGLMAIAGFVLKRKYLL